MTINNAAREAARQSNGEFGTQEHALPTRSLDAEKDWGHVEISEGSRTPWGGVQHYSPIAPGIVQVGTAGHGGIKLSAERNKEIPTALRNRNGWYEEDCEASIVTMTYAEEFSAERRTWSHLPADHVDPYADPEFMKADSERVVKDYFPDQYEKATGRELEPGESRARDEANWEKANEIHFVVRSAIRDEKNPGKVRVTARQAATGTDRTYLIDADEYSSNREGPQAPGQNSRFVIDPKKHLWTGI